MDTGILNTSRRLNQVASELELKGLQPAAKVAGADEANAALSQTHTENGDPAQVKTEQKQALNKDELSKVVAQMNGALQDENRTIQFSLDEASGRTVIKVSDSKTGKAITQFPSEDVLEISRKLVEQIEQNENSSGLLLKSRA